MFIGHFAVGLGLKRVAPRTSLGTLVAAAQFIDLLWPYFLLLGWERVRIDPGNTAVTPLAFDSYPFTHSLAMAVLWGVLFAVAYALRTRLTVAAVWVGAAVVSHWVLDWVTHRPDLPLLPGGSAKVGLGLWNSVAGTVGVESVLFAAGIWNYLRATKVRDRTGVVNFWAYIVVLAVSYLSNLFGPPPSDPHRLAIFALGLVLLPLWAAWIDSQRHPMGRSAFTAGANRWYP